MKRLTNAMLMTVFAAIILLGGTQHAYVYANGTDAAADTPAVATETGDPEASQPGDAATPADGQGSGDAAGEDSNGTTEGGENDEEYDPETDAAIQTDVDYFKFLIEGSRIDVVKTWNRKPGVDQIKIKIRWKPDFDEDVETLHKAITKKGVDEATISEVLVRYYQVESSSRQAMIQALMDAYLNAKDKPLDEVLKKATLGKYEELILAVLKGEDVEGLTSNVNVDEEGYFYYETVVSKENGWKEAVQGVIAPGDAEITEEVAIECASAIGVKVNADGNIERIEVENTIVEEAEELVLSETETPEAAVKDEHSDDSNSNKAAKAVETSDSNDIYDWATLMIISLLALLSLCITKLGLRR